MNKCYFVSILLKTEIMATYLKLKKKENLYPGEPKFTGVRLHDGPDLKLFILVGWDRSFRLLLGPPGLN